MRFNIVLASGSSGNCTISITLCLISLVVIVSGHVLTCAFSLICLCLIFSQALHLFLLSAMYIWSSIVCHFCSQ